jgi:hypothetical protein
LHELEGALIARPKFVYVADHGAGRNGQQPNGTCDLPAQGTIAGTANVALLLTQAFAPDTSFAMGGLRDLAADPNYGAIGNAQDGSTHRATGEQGWYLRQAARLMPAEQVLDTTTGPDLQVLATSSDRRFSVQLVNYNHRTERSVTISVKGAMPKSRSRAGSPARVTPTGRSAR